MKTKSVLPVCAKTASGIGLLVAAIGVCAGAVIVAGIVKKGRIQYV